MNYEQLLSTRIQEVQPSGIRRFFDILEEMKDAISGDKPKEEANGPRSVDCRMGIPVRRSDKQMWMSAEGDAAN